MVFILLLFTYSSTLMNMQKYKLSELYSMFNMQIIDCSLI